MPDRSDDVHVDDEFTGDRAALFERMAAVASDPLYALDADREFVAVNDALVAFAGYPREALLGEPFGTVLANEAGTRSLELMSAKVADRGGSLAGEFRIRTADGTTRLVELEVTALGDGDAIVGTARDLTGDRRREERLEVLDRVLRHNLRNKIGTVLGYLDMLLDETDDPATVERAETARSEAKELLDISDKARRFHKLLELEPERSTVSDLRDVVDPVVDRQRSLHPAATITVEAGDHDPVVADPELVEAALREVVGNAIEHHDRDDPTVEVTVREGDDRVHVDVADDGPGIGPEEREAILSGREEPLYHASGLGIWLVKWAVQLTGGELDIGPNEPRGTVVTVSLPEDGAEG